MGAIRIYKRLQDLEDVVEGTPAKGDLLVYDGTDSYDKKARGNDGDVFTTDAASALGTKWTATSTGGNSTSDSGLIAKYDANGVLGTTSKIRIWEDVAQGYYTDIMGVGDGAANTVIFSDGGTVVMVGTAPTLTATNFTGTASININGTVGATTPNTVAGTTGVFSGTLTIGTTASQITGAAGNMTITAGTGNSRTMTFQTTTSGGVATNAVVIGATQNVTLANSLYLDSTSGGIYIRYNGTENNMALEQGGIAMTSSGLIQFASSATNNASGRDTMIGRQSAANLRQGAADAASPVAQTFSVQSVSTGTSNTAGANRTISGSQGTGTGVGGNIIFSTAPPAGSTGSAQNALSAQLTLNGDAIRSSTFVGPVKTGGYTVATLPTGVVGMHAYVTDATAPTYLGALTGGGAVTCPVFYNGAAWVSH